MNYTFVTAAYGDAAETVVIAQTVEAGAVVVSLQDRPELWQALLDSEIEIDPFPQPTSEALALAAADKRWRVEIGGCPWSGYTVATDRSSQTKLIAEFVTIGAGLRVDPSPWKMASGEFVPLSNAEMGAVILAARNHIAAAFAAEADLLDAIAAETVTSLAAIESWAWPSNT